MKLRIVSTLILGAALLTVPAGQSVAQADLGGKITAAKTAADHEAIAAEFEREAKDLEAQAAAHQTMAQDYGKPAYSQTAGGRMKKHCDALSANLKKAAQEAEELAKKEGK